MSKGVVELSDTQFEPEVLQAQGAVLAYFWAPWCGPCRLVSPSVTWAAETYGDRLKVVKMEVDPNPEAVKHCKVEGVPALVLFRDGQVLEALEGAIGKQQLTDLLEAHL